MKRDASLVTFHRLPLLQFSNANASRLERHPRRATGRGEPGAWGGHVVNAVAYDDQGCTGVLSWGILQRMTWQFYKTYCDEAYAVLSPDWLDGNDTAPNRLDPEALRTELSIITRGLSSLTRKENLATN